MDNHYSHARESEVAELNKVSTGLQGPRANPGPGIQLDHRLSACCARFIVLGCMMSFAFQTSGAEIKNAELLEFLMKKQEQARAGIRTLSIVSDRQLSAVASDNHGEITHEKVLVETMHRLQHGESLRLQGIGEVQRRSGPSGPSHSAMVQNEAYVATWRQTGTHITVDLQIAEHESLRRMSKNSSNFKVVVLEGFDLLRFGYGLGTFHNDFYTLRDIVAYYNMDSMVWSVERAMTADGGQYRVLLHDKRRPGDPVAVARIDPDKGFLTTSFEYKVFRRDGSVNRAIMWSIEAEEVAPGIWFPMALELENEFDDGAKSERSVYSERVTAIEVNPELSEEQFTWQSLNYPGTRAFFRDADGNSNVMQVRGGELIPDPVYSREARAALKKKKLLERLDLDSLIGSPVEDLALNPDSPLGQAAESVGRDLSAPADSNAPAETSGGSKFLPYRTPTILLGCLGVAALAAMFWRRWR